MSYVSNGIGTAINNGNYTLTSTSTGVAWTTPQTTVTAPLTITKEGSILVQDDVGETTDVGKAAKMFMWWMQTYHPELEEQFNAVEDTKR